MKTAESYRDSHVQPGKGAVYDQHYATLPWRKYLWSQEQRVLTSILDRYFKDRVVSLLDFACGTGRIASFLENRVETSTGVDVSGAMLDEARKKLRRTALIQADLTKNNILNGQTFNLITAFRFFLNAEPELRLEAMQTLVSLLARDGYVVFNNHNNRTSPLVWLKYGYHARIRGRGTNSMSIHEIRGLARKVGLKIVQIYPVGLLCLPRIRLPARLNHRIDNMALRFRYSGVLSESPIVVCRHCQ